jgi:predicted nucleic acid-binding protein
LNPYLDASVIVPYFIDETHSPGVSHFIDSLTAPPVLSDFAIGEFASAVARRVRMASLTAANARIMLADFDRWSAETTRPMAIVSADIADATALVRRFDLKLRLPDAIHLAACGRRALALATLDDLLADAAHALGVAHICPA